VASLFQAFLTGFPIVVIVKDDPRAFYLVLTLMIFVLSEGILLLIFLPKMLLAYRFSTMSEAEQRRVISDQIARSSSLHPSRRGSQTTGGAGCNEGAGNDPADEDEVKADPQVCEADSGKTGISPVDLGREAIIGSSNSDVLAAAKTESSGIAAVSSVTFDSHVKEENSGDFVAEITTDKLKILSD
jgi:hypothetical protein